MGSPKGAVPRKPIGHAAPNGHRIAVDSNAYVESSNGARQHRKNFVVTSEGPNAVVTNDNRACVSATGDVSNDTPGVGPSQPNSTSAPSGINRQGRSFSDRLTAHKLGEDLVPRPIPSVDGHKGPAKRILFDLDVAISDNDGEPDVEDVAAEGRGGHSGGEAPFGKSICNSSSLPIDGSLARHSEHPEPAERQELWGCSPMATVSEAKKPR